MCVKVRGSQAWPWTFSYSDLTLIPPWLFIFFSLCLFLSLPDSSSFKEQNKQLIFYIPIHSNWKDLKTFLLMHQASNQLSANKSSSPDVHCHIIIHLYYMPGRYSSWCLGNAVGRNLTPMTFIPCYYSCEYVTFQKGIGRCS